MSEAEPRSVKFTERESGRTRDKVGEAVGLSGITYQRASAVVDAAARARRNQTRTERNYYLGIRYLRERGDRGGNKSKGKKVPFDSTAQLIAAEENCSHQHVKNSAKMAEHIEELCCHLGHGALWVALFHRQKVQPVSASAPSCGPWRLAYRGAGCAASSATNGLSCSRSSVTLWGVFSRPWVCWLNIVA